MAHRVATVEDEARCLPGHVRLNSMTEAKIRGLEPVWMVNEETGEIDGGQMIDTYHDRYFTFQIFESPEIGFDLIATSDWQPLPEDD